MSIDTPVKRQRRTTDPSSSTSKSPRTPLSPSQLQSVRHAQYLDNGIIASEQLERLRAGPADLGQIAWSNQNVLAIASKGHVVVQYPTPPSSKRSLRPSYLLPEQKSFSTGPVAGPSRLAGGQTGEKGRYDDPQHICFSPCGYYLCAYFPVVDRDRGSKQSSPMLPDSTVASNSIPNQSSTAQLLDQLQPPTDPALSAPQDAASVSTPPSAPPTSLFCIWSRTQSASLNDWTLVQTIPVSLASRRNRAGSASKADNVVKVNDRGEQVSAGRASAPNKEDVILRGGVKHIVWLNKRRRIVVDASERASQYGANPFSRLPSRGPRFAETGETGGADEDAALVVFGLHGQITLLSSRKAERETGSGSFFTSTLVSSLYSPKIQPSPITLDSTSALAEGQSGEASSLFASNSNDEDSRITHLAVGMAANTSVLLVASRRSGSPAALIDVTEVTIDLQAEAVSLITRPLQPVSLSPELEPRELDPISILTWAEVDTQPAQEEDGPGLRLVACTSHLAPSMGSKLATWDVVKSQPELSDAFSSLECKKTGHAPRWLDWQVRFALSKRMPDKLITSFIEPPGLAVGETSIMTALAPAPGKPGLLTEQLAYVNLRTLDLTSSTTMPPRALNRTSDPAVSANGTLIATLSSKSVVLWSLPPQNSTLAQLLALASLRRSDASDISRSHSSSSNPSDLLIETADLLKVTDFKRPDDVLVKIEGATSKNPTHAPVPFNQALRLLKLSLSLPPTSSSSGGVEKLVLELGLCFSLLRNARVSTEVTVVKEEAGGKNKKAAKKEHAIGETKKRVYYKLDSVYPLLAQLGWFLGLLDGLARLALSPVDRQNELVQLLSKPTLRRLVLQVVAHFVDFSEWLLSTTNKTNLPPPAPLDEAFQNNGGSLLAVSEQLALARDALKLVIGETSVDLGEFAKLLLLDDKEGGKGNGEGERFWWAHLSDTDTGGKSEDEKLLKAVVDPQGGTLVDILPLFIGLSDISDERGVLHEKASTLDLDEEPGLKQGSGEDRDVVRRVSLRSAVSQSAIVKDGASLIRNHPTQRLGGSEGEEVKVSVMRAKRCVRCWAVSQDPVVCTYSVPPLVNGGVDNQMQVQVQLQMQQMQMQLMQQQAVQTGTLPMPMPFMPQMPAVQAPAPKLVRIELSPQSSTASCLCGGSWWVL